VAPVGSYGVDSVRITAINKGSFYSKILSLGFSHTANGANQATIRVCDTGKVLRPGINERPDSCFLHGLIRELKYKQSLV